LPDRSVAAQAFEVAVAGGEEVLNELTLGLSPAVGAHARRADRVNPAQFLDGFHRLCSQHLGKPQLF
jgi:hypothetical protein